MGEKQVGMCPCHQMKRLWAWRGPHEDFLYSLDSSADREGGREGGERVGVEVAVFKVVPDLGLSCETGFIFCPSAWCSPQLQAPLK